MAISNSGGGGGPPRCLCVAAQDLKAKDPLAALVALGALAALRSQCLPSLSGGPEVGARRVSMGETVHGARCGAARIGAAGVLRT